MKSDEELLRGLIAQAEAAQTPLAGPPPLGYQVEITIKGTRLCNLRCTYCQDWRSGAGHTMKSETVEALILKALEDPKHRVIGFNWHGGEPLVLPISFYQRAIDLQAQHRKENQQITNSIQTNGVLVTDEWAHFLGANSFAVGVSIDGPAAIHDEVRVSKAGTGTFSAVAKGLEKLRKNKVSFGVLVTLSRSMLELGAAETLDFLLSLGAQGVGLNPVRPGHLDSHAPAWLKPIFQDEFNQFLIALYEERKARGVKLAIREIDSVLTQIQAQGSSSCMLAGYCFGTFYVVEPNGDIGHCSRFIYDNDFYFGNIVAQSFDEIRATEKLEARRNENSEALAAKASCPTFEICNGGCPHERLVETRHNPSYNRSCCGRQSLIEYLKHQG